MLSQQPAIDRQAIQGEIAALLKSGMPEPVVMGFMEAKARDLVDRWTESQWDEARRIVDEVGQQAHGGDPVKKARVDQFNEMFLTKLRAKQAAR